MGRRRYTEPFKIGIFLWWFEIGGTERHALRLVRGLLERNHQVEIICFKAMGSLTEEFRSLGCPIIELRSSSKIRSLFFPLDLYVHLRRNRYDVFHSLLTDTLIIGPLAAKFAGVENIITSERNEFDWKLRPPKKLLAGWVTRACTDRVVVNSRSIGWKLAARENIDPENIFVVPNGYDGLVPESISEPARATSLAQLRQRFPGLGAGPFLGMIGSLLPLKDHSTVIKALPSLIQDFPEITLIMVGDGAEGPRLRRLAQEIGMENHIVWTGRLLDVFPVLQLLDLLIVASLREGFPNVVVEALGVGVSVISSELPYLEDLGPLRFAVRSFPTHDDITLARRIAAALADSDWRTSVKVSAPSLVREQYGAHREVESHLRVYEGIATGISLKNLGQRPSEH